MADSSDLPVQPLYANFLEKKSTYQLTRHFWKKQFDEVLGVFDHPFHAYHEEKNYDGHPIFTAYFPTLDRTVRINQHAPKDEQLHIEAQLDQILLDGKEEPVAELRVDLVLSKKSANLTRQLLRQWIIAYRPARDMNEEIRKRLND